MQFRLERISCTASVYDVKRAIAQVLHGEDFSDESNPEARQINFKVVLDMDPDGLRGVQNMGTGTLTLPRLKSFDLHRRFSRWIREHRNAIRVDGRPIRISSDSTAPRRLEAIYLGKSRYIPPEHEEARDRKLFALRDPIRVNTVQMGVLFYPPGLVPQNRAFSTEWEYPSTPLRQSWIVIDYDQKTLRIELGDLHMGNLDAYILISFADIDKIGVGFEAGNAFACLALSARPTFEKPINANVAENFDVLYEDDVEEFNIVDIEETESLGSMDPMHYSSEADRMRLNHEDTAYTRKRITQIDDGHGHFIRFTPHFRLVFPSEETLHRFRQQCTEAGLPASLATLETFSRKGLLSEERIRKIFQWMQQFNDNWPFAFQLAALIYNGCLNAEDLGNLRADLGALYATNPDDAADILKHFRAALSSDPSSVRDYRGCLARIAAEQGATLRRRPSDRGVFTCYHITFTPTRMILEGPSRTQSNSIIRKHWANREHFIRVDFLDENQSHYRFDREVDGPSFLQTHVGTILKGGFWLAGRDFYLLGYSNSSLEDHVFWFVHPFWQLSRELEPEFMTADEIRRRIGDLSDIKLPAKYAARVGQAFTSSECSVYIWKHQWREIPEILEDRDNPRSHVDGLGRISQKLGDRFWEKVCAKNSDRKLNNVKPSAYQIRFLGYKGVVAVDPQLEGYQMHLRPEMRKFWPFKCDDCRESGEVFCYHLNDPAPVHIAEAFDGPKRAYLTRDLVTILEDREVRPQAFVELLESAQAKTYMARDSSTGFVEILKTHHMAFNFRVPFLLQRLSDVGLDYGKQAGYLDENFLHRVREYAIQHVLRDMKNRARIPVPQSHLLVGVADEGPAYAKEGLNVYKLQPGQIYACVQESNDSEPKWLKGDCIITRSPQVHAGDVQRVRAIGKPEVPEGQICLFEHMKNVVVLPSVGPRSLASCLGGGDLDGDLYYVFQYGKLLPTLEVPPADYSDARPPGRDFNMNDVCDFIVEFMHSNALGILSTRRLIIADQSKHGIHDARCIELAKLCSDAVDYPKNGCPVNVKRAPKKLIPYSPDWHVDEDSLNDPLADSYRSDRTLGILYRMIAIDPLKPSHRSPTPTPSISSAPAPLTDTMSTTLLPLIEAKLGHGFLAEQASAYYPDSVSLFKTYLSELRCIAITHSMSAKPSAFIPEEELVLGIILAPHSERRVKKDRTYRMREDVTDLVRQIRQILLPSRLETPTRQELRAGLQRAWSAWCLSVHNRELFGANSFGLIALGVLFDAVDKLQIQLNDTSTSPAS